jgi:signal peptidase I
MNDVSGSGRGSDKLAGWLLVPLVALLALILIVFYGLFHTTTVDGESMLPTLRPADKVLVTKGYARATRNDIVVIHLLDAQGRPEDIVKRVVGVPGDTVEVREDVAWVNGSREASHPMIVDPTQAQDYRPVTVPDGAVYVMGDDRPVSLDSRYIGFIPLADVQGRVEAVFAPVGRIRFVR